MWKVMASVCANRSLVWRALTSWVRSVRISGSGGAVAVAGIRVVSVAGMSVAMGHPPSISISRCGSGDCSRRPEPGTLSDIIQETAVARVQMIEPDEADRETRRVYDGVLKQ